MPTYEYRCNECGHEFEEFQSITADPLDTCPACQGPAKRLISAGAGLLFKGSGFYITDYRSKSYQESAKVEKTKKAGVETGATSSSKKKGDSSTGSGSSTKSSS